MFLPPSCRGISITASNTKRHIVNDLVWDELVCTVRFGTPGRKFGHRRRGPFTLPPQTVPNLSRSLTTSAPLRPAKMPMYRVMSRNPAADIADVGLRLLVVFLPFFLRERLAATGTSQHKRHYHTLCSCRRRFGNGVSASITRRRG